MKKIKSVEQYGQLYMKRFLQDQIAHKDAIYDDWREALEFLFSKVFYRGRRDELSERFMWATLKTLKEIELDPDYNKQLLDNRLQSNGVNNHKDRKMVCEVLDFVFNLPTPYGRNIVKYTIERIKNGKILDIFNELNTIYAIGDKLSSFYIRDVALVFDLEDKLLADDFKYCQPIDTWVKQVAVKLDLIAPQEGDVATIKSAIIDACRGANVSPLLFNAGAWMVGAKSFDLLIERFSTQ
ncbi:hypothetical protein A3K24_02440 [candidate division Kazan bacterium RIFCSPHIGHO2_01_FULL_44_14]|uniref:Uncharacterized protein n=1 Tax=candidate division Kazan bacterium RIFCSPLOWO2_01_FULL_45_19 TaxID=1798538 RepID=A0A1F4NQD7_UNCK3|nr:hypothetical protein [uncultured bacterium]AQS31099.1 hypothetical protein [uncultured bacterium]OGB73674.1 MAG: hypothetical protein A3K51_02440 [candidate division Kazan bacterium RIFCSPLOWO2_01_FULL_45_19]OGB77919.1 MAG: hypothetical protein A3K24_02440 [candidate division Kazan bacterium RIFCSPHIGHO2_01_FULL_44_14]